MARGAETAALDPEALSGECQGLSPSYPGSGAGGQRQGTDWLAGLQRQSGKGQTVSDSSKFCDSREPLLLLQMDP